MKGIFVASLCFAVCARAADPPACSNQDGCDAARAALVDAESAVADAVRHKALWTTAQSALLEARASFTRGDYDAAAKAAALAAELAQLGMAQTRYPPVPAPTP